MDAHPSQEPAEATLSLSLTLVNDDRAQLMVQRRLLGRIAEVVGFLSPIEALAAVRSQALPSNLITDFHMPGMDGPELARAWCDLVPHAKVLVISASEVSRQEQDRIDSLPADAVRLVTSYRILDLIDHACLWFGQEVETEDSPDAASSAERRLDRSVLEKLGKLGGEAFVAKTIARFTQGAPEKVQSISDAWSRADRQRMYELAHSLKGSCGLVGAVTMAESADAIELATSPEDPSGISDTLLSSHVEQLQRESHAVLAELESFHL